MKIISSRNLDKVLKRGMKVHVKLINFNSTEFTLYNGIVKYDLLYSGRETVWVVIDKIVNMNNFDDLPAVLISLNNVKLGWI